MYRSIIGNPEDSFNYFDGQQSLPYDCAIRCQETIIQQFLDTDIDELELVNIATKNGWYIPAQGTPPEHMGALLNYFGIETETKSMANITDLMTALAQGKKVIVSVDSEELLDQDHRSAFAELFNFDDKINPDHAVMVTGIDTTDPENPLVYITDPGTGERAAVYSFNNFMDAWADGNSCMVYTTDPAPPHLPEMVNFDYELGHIPYIGDTPYQIYISLGEDTNQLIEPKLSDLKWIIKISVKNALSYLLIVVTFFIFQGGAD